MVVAHLGNKECKKMSTINVPSGMKFMDRNIGATTKLTGEIGAVGVQYQFGRKDPFTASSTFVPLSDEILLYDLKNNHPFIENALGPRDFAFATANPLTFIVMADLIDWCDVDIRTWWIYKDGTKTIYEPCPQGWRVPAIEDFEGITDDHVDKTIADGHNFIFNGQSNYWPYSGYREVGGIMEANAVVGTFWCNLPIPGDAGIGASFSPSYGMGGTQAMNGSPRARGLTIRCIKE